MNATTTESQTHSKVILNRGRVTVAVARPQGQDYLELQQLLTNSVSAPIDLTLENITAQNKVSYTWHLKSTTSARTYQIESQYIAPIPLSYPNIHNQAAVAQIRQDILQRKHCLRTPIEISPIQTGTILSVKQVPFLFFPNAFGEQLFAFTNPNS